MPARRGARRAAPQGSCRWRLSLSPLARVGAGLVLIGANAIAQDRSTVPYDVAPSARAQIQALLDQHRSIRLEPNQDYRSEKVGHLRISSGQSIVGGWNTRVPAIYVTEGSSNVVLSNIRSDARFGPDIVFEAGREIHDVDIVGGNGGEGTNIRVKIEENARVSHLSVAEYGGLEVDQAGGGYVRDSVFTRLLGRWPGPHVLWHGNLDQPSGGNSFVGVISLSPLHTAVWSRVGDIWLVGLDCESWGSEEGSDRIAFLVDEAVHVHSVGLSGGTAYPSRSGALALIQNTPVFDSWFLHGSGGSVDNADIILDGVHRSAFAATENHHRVLVRAPDRDSTLTDLSGQIQVTVSDSPSPAINPSGDERSFALLADFAGRPRVGAPQKPVRREISAPEAVAVVGGPHTEADSAPRLQAAIDSEGVATIEPGTYYLNRPLRIGNRSRVEGLLSRGPRPAVLIATGDFPVIQGRGGYGYADSHGGAIIRLALGGLTLYGGSYGIDWTGSKENLGDGATVAYSTFYDLRFLNQTQAGVRAEGIHGLDSNFWYRVDFLDVPTAIFGRGHGTGGGMNYADKQHFLDCQFQNIRGAAWNWKADRASNAELWKDAYFFNVGGVAETRAAVGLIWANSVFENVLGDVGIHVTDSGSTATYYFAQIDCLWKGIGPKVVTDTLSFGMGTLFIDSVFSQSGGSILADGKNQTLYALGSSITGSAKLGPVETGMFLNSKMPPVDRAVELFSTPQSLRVLGPPSTPYGEVLAR